ncbi:putative cytochrome P450 [Ixodes scapularis]
MQSLVNKIGEAKGSTISVREHLLSISFDVITTVLFGSAFKLNDHKHRELEKLLCGILQELHVDSFVDFKPVWLSNIMASVPFTKMAAMRNTMRLLREFIRERIKEHRNTPKDATFDFVDYYLNQMEEHKDDPDSYFRENHLIGCAMDFLVGGVASPPYFANWLLLVCAKSPDTVQSRIQAEIDRVVGSERQPTWSDRLEMPFTMACTWEILRWKPDSPIGMPRGVKEDIFLDGYFIPKGTVVLSNAMAMSMNPGHWTRPSQFDPSKFLSPDGSGLIKKPEFLIPFASGKRMCPGEALASVQLFLYTTCLLQKYSVLPEEGQELPCLDSVVTVGNDAPILKLQFVPR